jgi:hypothetical protein
VANLAQRDYDDTHLVPIGVGIASQLVNCVRSGKTIKEFSVSRGYVTGAAPPRRNRP